MVRTLISLLLFKVFLSQTLTEYLDNIIYPDTSIFHLTDQISSQYILFNQINYTNSTHHVLFINRNLLNNISLKLKHNTRLQLSYKLNESKHKVDLKKNNVQLYQYIETHNYRLKIQHIHNGFILNTDISKEKDLSYSFGLDYNFNDAFRIKYNFEKKKNNFYLEMYSKFLNDQFAVPLGNHSHLIGAKYNQVNAFIKYSIFNEKARFIKKKSTTNRGKALQFQFAIDQKKLPKVFFNYDVKLNTIRSFDDQLEFLKLDELKSTKLDLSARWNQFALTYHKNQIELLGNDSYFEQFSYNILDFINPTKYRLRNLESVYETISLSYTYKHSPLFHFSTTYEHILSLNSNYLLRERFFITFPISSYKGEAESINPSIDSFVRLEATKTIPLDQNININLKLRQDIPLDLSSSSDASSGTGSSKSSNKSISGGTQMMIHLNYLIK